MQILGVHTPLLHPHDDLARVICASVQLQPKDIVVVSSKVLATCEGAAIDLRTVAPSVTAIQWSKKCAKSPEFCEAVLAECARLNGKVIGSAKGALLTLLSPTGMKGNLLVPNAGLDQSNVDKHFAIGWPVDPVASARTLKTKLASYGVAVIVSDSCCSALRKGVTAFALACAGIDPIVSRIGIPDLFGTPLSITYEARADQLAVAANAVMGNAAESVPAAVIRDHRLPMSEYCGWVDGMHTDEDLFKDVLKL